MLRQARSERGQSTCDEVEIGDLLAATGGDAVGKAELERDAARHRHFVSLEVRREPFDTAS
jgi:hypothetical protein